LLLSARFGSADALLDVMGSLDLGAYINAEHIRVCKNPSDQGNSATCPAHATAAVLHMALLRIVGREGGYPSIEEIRTKILTEFPPNEGGQSVRNILAKAKEWYRPLQFNEVDEDGARQAVLHCRPVLTTFCLSDPGWGKFSDHFSEANTKSSVLTRDLMASFRDSRHDGGHAVVMYQCAPGSLTFLNSWGDDWGENGSFSVEDYTVLEVKVAEKAATVCFYDVFWLEKDLTDQEREKYQNRTDDVLGVHAEQYPSILELEVCCPYCSKNAPIGDYTGNIRQAVCPLCRKPFKPEPGYLVQALYARAGLSDVI
jgi:hypothetical protein